MQKRLFPLEQTPIMPMLHSWIRAIRMQMFSSITFGGFAFDAVMAVLSGYKAKEKESPAGPNVVKADLLINRAFIKNTVNIDACRCGHTVAHFIDEGLYAHPKHRPGCWMHYWLHYTGSNALKEVAMTHLE